MMRVNSIAILVAGVVSTSTAWAQTNNVKVTVKSFLGRIGAKTGSFGSRVRDAALFVFAKATDVGFSEDPRNDGRDKKYRALSEMRFSVVCNRNRVMSFRATPLETDTGKEGPLQAPPGVASGVSSKQDGASATFQWAVRAMPHEFTLPAFNAIKSRTSVWVWHTIGGRISCANGRAAVSTNLTGSKFPTHRVFVDGVPRATIPQGPFTNLWRAKVGNPALVD